jgi:hypothetical protein
VRFHINAPAKVESVRITLDRKTIKTTKTTKSRFTLRQAGKRTTVSRTITRCAPPKPRRKAAPRFTG